MTARASHIARPAILWALHFIAIYALISAACAERALIGNETMVLLALGLTAAAALLALAWLILGVVSLRRMQPASPGRPLAVATVWTAAISLLAILADLWPVVAIPGCHG